MYEIVWTPTAKETYYSIIEYWIKHNQSNTYSLKIINEVEKLEIQISKDPYFLSTYIHEIKLYRKLLLRSVFSLFYEIKEDKKQIIIKYFRDNRQKPLY